MWWYNFIRFVSYPIYRVVLWFKYKNNRSIFYEKMGHPTADRPKGDVIWFHCHDFEKAGTVLTELKEAFWGRTILMTYDVRDQNSEIDYGPNVICQFAPIDTYFSVLSFLKFWEVTIAVRTESGLYPIQLSMLKKLQVPSFLVNAYMHSKTYKKWKFMKRLARKSISGFSFIWALNNTETLHFANLGAQDIMSQDIIDGHRIRTIVHKIKHGIN